MKKKLPLSVLLITSLAFSQSSITSFFGTEDYNYTNLNATPALSHSTTGANVTWNFTNIPTNGTSFENNTLPTTAELATFPNTTIIHNVSTVTPSSSDAAKIYCRNTTSNVFSLTGTDANGVILNYNTNNAIVGTFPLAFGYTNNDTSSGTFINGTNTLTFTGTIATNYDSHGTLNLQVNGFAPLTYSASRVKVTQNINLNAGFLGTIGTIVQTIYTYYVEQGGVAKPLFRDTTNIVNIPLLGVNETTNQVQIFTSELTSLGISTYISEDTISFYPNPSSDFLTINNPNGITVNSISINDLNGRTVLLSNSNTSKIDIQNLSKGVYIIQFETENGIVSSKFIKK